MNSQINSISLSPLIQPLNSDYIVQADLHLGAALEKISSSHGALLVFDQKNFLGLCSPYQTLYRSRLPYSTKVRNSLVYPPRLHRQSSIYELAESMAALRVYTLPIFEKEKVIGIINAKTFLKKLTEDEAWLNELALKLQPTVATTNQDNLTVNDAYEVMRNGTGRLVIVTPQGRLQGIVTRSDIKHAFLYPPDYQRFSGRIGNTHSYTFDPAEKIDPREESIKPYISSPVIHVPQDKDRKAVLRQLLTTSSNSIVLTDLNNRPRGIISLRPILLTLADLAPQQEINVELIKPSDSVPPAQIEEAYQVLYEFGKKLSKRIQLARIKASFKEAKSITRKTFTYETTLQVIGVKKDPVVATSKARLFLHSLRRAVALIEKQLQDVNKFNSRKAKMNDQNQYPQGGSAFIGQKPENLRDDNLAELAIEEELIDESTGNDTLNEATPPHVRDSQAVSGTLPDPESDDDTLLMSQQVGLRVDETVDDPQPLDIASEISKAERSRRQPPLDQ